MTTVHQNACKDNIVDCNKPKTGKVSINNILYNIILMTHFNIETNLFQTFLRIMLYKLKIPDFQRQLIIFRNM